MRLTRPLTDPFKCRGERWGQQVACKLQGHVGESKNVLGNPLQACLSTPHKALLVSYPPS